MASMAKSELAPALGPCSVCGAQDAKACARCRIDYYCGKAHQTADWERHKLGCAFVQARQSPLLGRHLVATKDIPAGKVLAREEPLVTFPTPWRFPEDETQPFSMCVGCGAELIVGAEAQCAPCGWPVCREECARRAEHRAECAAFQRAKFRLTKAQAVAPGSVRMNALVALRVCLAFQEPERGPRLRGLPARMPDKEAALGDAGAYRETVLRGHESFWRGCRQSVDWLQDVAGVGWLPREDLLQALACAQLHGMEGNCESEFHLIRGVFATLSMAGHACLPNACCYSDQRHGTRMTLVASRAVRPGEALTTAFVHDPLDAMQACDAHRRRTLLAAQWGFRCRCALCEDPAQAGLRLDAWKCCCWERELLGAVRKLGVGGFSMY